MILHILYEVFKVVMVQTSKMDPNASNCSFHYRRLANLNPSYQPRTRLSQYTQPYPTIRIFPLHFFLRDQKLLRNHSLSLCTYMTNQKPVIVSAPGLFTAFRQPSITFTWHACSSLPRISRGRNSSCICTCTILECDRVTKYP